ncbi:hypothetical protein AOLI_G00139340 [Acnodon oligacanthus]
MMIYQISKESGLKKSIIRLSLRIRCGCSGADRRRESVNRRVGPSKPDIKMSNGTGSACGQTCIFSGEGKSVRTEARDADGVEHKKCLFLSAGENIHSYLEKHEVCLIPAVF